MIDDVRVRQHGRGEDHSVFQGQEHPHHRLNWLSWEEYVIFRLSCKLLIKGVAKCSLHCVVVEFILRFDLHMHTYKWLVHA